MNSHQDDLQRLIGAVFDGDVQAHLLIADWLEERGQGDTQRIRDHFPLRTVKGKWRWARANGDDANADSYWLHPKYFDRLKLGDRRKHMGIPVMEYNQYGMAMIDWLFLSEFTK